MWVDLFPERAERRRALDAIAFDDAKAALLLAVVQTGEVPSHLRGRITFASLDGGVPARLRGRQIGLLL